MKKVIIAFGIPNAGKTSFLDKHFPKEKRGDYLRLCPDDFSFSAASSELFGTTWWDAPGGLKEKIIESLQKKDIIIIELAAASSSITRRSLIKFLREKGAEQIEGLYFSTPLAVAKERNSKKESQVSDKIMEEMDKRLQDHPPTLEDGFDYIKIIR